MRVLIVIASVSIFKIIPLETIIKYCQLILFIAEVQYFSNSDYTYASIHYILHNNTLQP